MQTILDRIVLPRPNGSQAFYQVAEYIKDWLEGYNLTVVTHEFVMQSYINEIAGAIIIIIASLWFYSSLSRKSLWAPALILLMGLLLLAEFSLGISTVSRLGQQTAENIIVSVPPRQVEQQLILSAHYDSKTQIFDHHQREVVFRLLVPMMVCSIILALWRWFTHRRVSPPQLISRIQVMLLIFVLFYWVLASLTFGGGFLAKPSPGAVDNATSVAILMELARQLKDEELIRTEVTTVFFAAEEINLQGARAFIREYLPQTPIHPVYNINLEMLAQAGCYIYWPEDGTFTGRYATNRELNELLGQAVVKVTGMKLIPKREFATGISDAGMFLQAGIPATTLGNAGPAGAEGRFLHTHKDNKDRIIPERLQEVVAVLRELILLVDQRVVLP